MSTSKVVSLHEHEHSPLDLLSGEDLRLVGAEALKAEGGQATDLAQVHVLTSKVDIDLSSR
jgi:hypothetical protein